jgi:hypothetical protein
LASPEYVAVTVYVPVRSAILQLPLPEALRVAIVHRLVPSVTITDPVRAKPVPPTVTLKVTFPVVLERGEADAATDGVALLTVSEVVPVAEL